MKETARFGEYTLSGSVFWLLISIFISLLILVNKGTVSLESAILLWQEWLQPLNALNSTGSLDAVFAVIAVVLLFVTGLLLDLMSQYYYEYNELCVFRKRIINEHRPWLDELIAKHPSYIQDDYNGFLQDELLQRAPINKWCEQYRLWRRQRYRYNKLRSFMIAYIMVNAGGAPHDELKNQLNIWRTSRAISMSVLLFCALLFIVNWQVDSEPLVFFISVSIPYIFYAGSRVIAQGTFSRLCLVLFALMYNTNHSESR